MNTARHLLTIAEAYSRATGVSLTELAMRSTGGTNNNVFHRIRAGKGCSTTTLDTILRWLDENWPANTPWPESVWRGPPLQKPRLEVVSSWA